MFKLCDVFFGIIGREAETLVKSGLVIIELIKDFLVVSDSVISNDEIFFSFICNLIRSVEEGMYNEVE